MLSHDYKNALGEVVQAGKIIKKKIQLTLKHQV